MASALGCVDGAIAPALSVMFSGAVLLTVHRAYRAERGAEPGCLVQSARHGLCQLIVGFYRVRSIGDRRARAGKPDLKSTLPCARAQAADVPTASLANITARVSADASTVRDRLEGCGGSASTRSLGARLSAAWLREWAMTCGFTS